MQPNTFTLIDAFNQFWTAYEHGDRRALSCAGLTYFYLCSVWNATGRDVLFRRQNNLICADLMISKPTLERHRNVLKQAGLIDFFSKGKGDVNITYKIMELRPPPEELKKEKNITSPVPSVDTNQQGKHLEEALFVVISGEVKKCYYLQNLFQQDAGLQMNYKQKGLPAGKFSTAVEQWMIQNHGCSYADFDKARKHFLYWMPNFKLINETDHAPKSTPANRKTIAQPRKTDMDYASGL